jgi:polyisoprenoid-binding protein YceI
MRARSFEHPDVRVLFTYPMIAIALLVGLALNIANAQESTPESEVAIGVTGNAPVYIACDENVTAGESAEATPIPATSPATVYALDSTQSAARYIAQEELANQGAATAIGETNSIVGNIYFDADGNPLACSRWDVDMRTLVSDESRRDNYLRGDTLETDTYPVATFVLTSVEGLDGALVDGEETTFYLVGNLTFHGVTNQVRWEVTATLSGDQLTGSANTQFDMAQYNIEPPTVGPVLSIDETVELEVDLVAAKA